LPRIPKTITFKIILQYYYELVEFSKNYKDSIKDCAFIADILCLSYSRFQSYDRLKKIDYVKKNEGRSKYQIYQTKARLEVVRKLNSYIEEDSNQFIQLNGLYGVGKSFTLADFVMKARLETLKEIENRDSNKILNLFVYLYLKKSDEKKYVEYLVNEIVYACMPLIHKEIDILVNKKYDEIEKVGPTNFTDKKSLLNLIFSLCQFNYNEFPVSVLKEIIQMINEKYNARFVLVVDQINEIKRPVDNLTEKIEKNNILQYIYDKVILENTQEFVLIQCASNNNEYTRENYMKFLNNTNDQRMKM